MWENVFIVPGMKAKQSPQKLLDATGSTRFRFMPSYGYNGLDPVPRHIRPVCFVRSSQTCRLRKVLTDIFGPTRCLLRKVLTDTFKSWFEGGVCTWMPPRPPMTDTHTHCGSGISDGPNYAINTVEHRWAATSEHCTPMRRRTARIRQPAPGRGSIACLVCL